MQKHEHTRQVTWLPWTRDVHLNHVFRISWKTWPGNLHDVLSRKQITDMLASGFPVYLGLPQEVQIRNSCRNLQHGWWWKKWQEEMLLLLLFMMITTIYVKTLIWCSHQTQSKYAHHVTRVKIAQSTMVGITTIAALYLSWMYQIRWKAKRQRVWFYSTINYRIIFQLARKTRLAAVNSDTSPFGFSIVFRTFTTGTKQWSLLSPPWMAAPCCHSCKWHENIPQVI